MSLFHKFAFCFIACALLFAPTATAADFFKQAIDATEIGRGLCVIVGPGDVELDTAFAESGDFVVERLLTEWPEVYSHRAALAKAGVFPLANVQHTHSVNPLPYADHLINLLIIDLDALGAAAPTEEEIKRVLAFEGKAYVKRSNAWQVIENPTPDDVDTWPHALRGPDRRPVSKDKRIQPHMEGVKWFNEKYSDVGQQGAGMRIADGKVYYTRVWVEGRGGDWRYQVVARDA